MARDEDRNANQDPAKPKKDLGASEVDSAIAEENEKGFRGNEVDPTPNENYTLSGVTSGAPTPETDDGLRAKAREAAGVR
jgi:hypothetical protein